MINRNFRGRGGQGGRGQGGGGQGGRGQGGGNKPGSGPGSATVSARVVGTKSRTWPVGAGGACVKCKTRRMIRE